MPTWMPLLLKRIFLLIAILLVVGVLSLSRWGIPEPKTKNALPLNPIERFQSPKKVPYYRAKRLNGKDVLVSPYSLGQFGGTLYQAVLGEGPKTLNPWASFDATSSAMGSMLTCQPVQTHAHTGETLPWIAKSFTISPDKKRIRLVFRDGLKWSDGHPLTVDDLLFTWNVIIQKGLGNPSTRDILLVDGQFPTMKKINKNTVEVATVRPYAPLLLNLGQAIAPKHIFEPVIRSRGEEAFGAMWSTQEAEEHPERFVSCGAWILEKYQSKERIIFKRNPYYFVVNADGKHLPYLDREVFTFAKDMSHIQLLFEQGALHTHMATPQNLGRLQRLKKPAFRMIDLGASDGANFVMLNLNTRRTPDGKAIVDPIKLKWFQNKAFRQALHYAVNRPQMVENVLKGLGSPLLTSMGLNNIYLNRELASQTPYDLTKAKRLLKDAGFRLNGKHELLDGSGHRVSFDLLTNSGNTERESALVQLQHDYAQLGIQLNLRPIEFNTLVDRMKTGRWEAMLMGLSGGSNFEPQQSANVFKSEAALHLFNQRTAEDLAKGVDDRYPFEAKIDRLYDLGTTEFSFSKRQPYYDEIQRILYDESPMIYLFTGKVILAIRSELQNIDATPLGGALHNVESIWLK